MRCFILTNIDSIFFINFFINLDTYFKYHTCESRNKDGRALYNINSQGQSQVGPLKAKIVAHKSFHPY